MKTLAIVAVVLGIIAIGFGVYGLVETLPNHQSLSAHMAGPQAALPGSTLGDLERASLQSYRDTLELQGMAALGAGVLAVVLGVVGAVKGKSALGWVGAVLGIAGGVMGAMLFP